MCPMHTIRVKIYSSERDAKEKRSCSLLIIVSSRFSWVICYLVVRNGRWSVLHCTIVLNCVILHDLVNWFTNRATYDHFVRSRPIPVQDRESLLCLVRSATSPYRLWRTDVCPHMRRSRTDICTFTVLHYSILHNILIVENPAKGFLTQPKCFGGNGVKY